MNASTSSGRALWTWSRGRNGVMMAPSAAQLTPMCAPQEAKSEEAKEGPQVHSAHQLPSHQFPRLRKWMPSRRGSRLERVAQCTTRSATHRLRVHNASTTCVRIPEIPSFDASVCRMNGSLKLGA
jgi:hypothetical protein